MIDGLFIRSLLMAFFFKLFPDIIRDGRLYIAEPPLYRVSDKKNPFVINMADYNERYVKQASKDYKLGYKKSSKDIVPEYLTKDQWFEFLSESTNYVDDIETLTKHYKVNDRLLEMILEEFSYMGYDDKVGNDVFINRLNIQHLMNRIGTEFKELYYDDKDNVIKGAIDSKYQMISINQELLRKSSNLINIMNKWLPGEKGEIILKDIKTSTEQSLSLLSILKILKKYQPNILHRFKGLMSRPI